MQRLATVNPHATEPQAHAPWQTPERRPESSPVHEAGEADAYDRMVARHRALLNAPFAAHVSRVACPGARVLDIGCGPGWIPCELARRNPGWQVVAIDPSEEMLARGRREAERSGLRARVRFERGEACALPFEDGAFDLVVSNYVLHHIDAPERMLAEAARVVRPGGRLIVKDLLRLSPWQAWPLRAFSRHVLRYDAEQMQLYEESLRAAFTLAELRVAVRKAGLSEARVRRFRVIDAVIEARG
ncbi:MAG: class I SAM-dependent methyltransferase [Planctomycetota bacterium]|nr:class I SAM-dependent methyltransferase [Planctomycetota bacterium]